MTPPALPTLVIGGYLGAGKTTLINQLLRQAGGRRIAVLVNDFGELPIDADLIEGASGEVLALAGGCICCSFGADLVGTLQSVAARSPRPDQVLIETSGVGLPAAVARTARLAREVQIDALAVVVDAQDVMARADDRFVGDTVRQQIAQADLLLLSRTDLVDDARVRAVQAWLGLLAPEARILPTAGLDGDVLLGLALDGAAGASDIAGTDGDPGASRRRAGSGIGRRDRIGPDSPAALRFESESLDIPAGIDAQALGRALTAPDLGVVRAKGFVRDASGQVLTLQTVGPRVSLTPSTKALPGDGRLVVLRLRGSPPVHPGLLALFTAASQR